MTARAILALVLVLLIGGAALGRGLAEPVSLDDVSSMMAAEAPTPDDAADAAVLPTAVAALALGAAPRRAVVAAAPALGAGRAHALAIFRPPRLADARARS